MATAHTNENQTRDNTDYLLDTAGEHADARLRDLSTLHDEHTIHHLNKRGIEEGWCCLEVGGGDGSITSWLSAQVGVTGRVLTTDIQPRFLQALSFPNLEVCRHDIRDDPLPTGGFDLVHARLVLMHLPERENALRRMVAALKPGGWIVIEEFDDLWLLPNPAINAGEASLRASPANQRGVTSAGVHLRHGRSLPQTLQSNDLVNIGAEACVFVWKARSAGTRLVTLNCQELREATTGWRLMAPDEFEADLNRVDDQDFFTLSQKLWTVWGQLP